MNFEIMKQAVQELDERIHGLTQCRDTLVKLLPETQRMTTALAPAANRPPKGGTPSVQTRGPVRKVKTKRPEAAEAGTDPATGTYTHAKPTTVAGAMKREIAGYGAREFTVSELTADLDGRHGQADFWMSKGNSAVSGNLSYWTKVGKLLKTDAGYKAADKGFFEDVQY